VADSATVPLEGDGQESAPEFVWNFSDHTVLSENTIFSIAEAGYNGFYYLDPQNGYNSPAPGRDTGLSNTNSTYFYRPTAPATAEQLALPLRLELHQGGARIQFGMEVERSTAQNRYGYPTGVCSTTSLLRLLARLLRRGYKSIRRASVSPPTQDTWR